MSEVVAVASEKEAEEDISRQDLVDHVFPHQIATLPK